MGRNYHVVAETFVYVLYNEDRGSCKIGKANDPDARARNLRTGSEDRLAITFRLSVDPLIASKVEVKARSLAETDLRKPRTREWLGRTTPDEARNCVELAHDIVRGRNWGRVVRGRMLMKLTIPDDDDAE